jgi:hypothetical protein
VTSAHVYSLGWQDMERKYGQLGITTFGYQILSYSNSEKIPMIAPFFGCLTGGFLYDLFVFTGDSPINEPGFGFGKKSVRRDMDHV